MQRQPEHVAAMDIAFSGCPYDEHQLLGIHLWITVKAGYNKVGYSEVPDKAN